MAIKLVNLFFFKMMASVYRVTYVLACSELCGHLPISENDQWPAVISDPEVLVNGYCKVILGDK